jgi:uncharacterized protein (UPF0261 family)
VSAEIDPASNSCSVLRNVAGLPVAQTYFLIGEAIMIAKSEELSQVIERIVQAGLSKDLVDVSSAKGAAVKESKHKTYYRLASLPQVGILLVDTKSAVEKNLAAMLKAEVENYATLRSLGLSTPQIYGTTGQEVIQTTNRIAGGIKMAAIFVEHIDGLGPYKPRTEIMMISKATQMQVPDKIEQVRNNYGVLRAVCTKKCPMDLQIIIRRQDGALIVIDPEAMGNGINLPPWPS